MSAELNGWVWKPVHDWGTLTIHVAGCGGTGGRVLAPLVKSIPQNIGSVQLHLWDADRVEERNLLRQNFFPEDVGRNKAEVFTERLDRVDPERINVISHPEMLLNITGQLSTYTQIIVLGCTDSPAFRQYMFRVVESHGQHYPFLWLDAGNERTTGQVVWNGYANAKVYNMLTPRAEQHTAVRQVRFRGLAALYPQLVDGSPDPFQGCGQRLDLQTTAVNQLAASWMICLLSNLLSRRASNVVGVQFSTDGDSQRIKMQVPEANQSGIVSI